MSSAQRYADIKALPPESPKRREAVRSYLILQRGSKGFTRRVAERAGVNPTMVSKVLHGTAVSDPVERAIFAEEEAHANAA